MYINFRLLQEKDISLSMLMLLVAINQKEQFIFQDIPYEFLEENELITYVKSGGTKEERLRLSKNGKALLDALTTRGATEEILTLTQELVELYEDSGKESGNILEVRSRLIWFIDSTGFSEKVIKDCVESYLSSSEFIMNLDNLIWKPTSTAFSVHYNLKESRLFSMISKKFNLPITFFLKSPGLRKSKETWLFDIMKMKVPSGLDDCLYWTESEKGDKEALKRLKSQFKFL